MNIIDCIKNCRQIFPAKKIFKASVIAFWVFEEQHQCQFLPLIFKFQRKFTSKMNAKILKEDVSNFYFLELQPENQIDHWLKYFEDQKIEELRIKFKITKTCRIALENIAIKVLKSRKGEKHDYCLQKILHKYENFSKTSYNLILKKDYKKSLTNHVKNFHTLMASKYPVKEITSGLDLKNPDVHTVLFDYMLRCKDKSNIFLHPTKITYSHQSTVPSLY